MHLNSGFIDSFHIIFYTMSKDLEWSNISFSVFQKGRKDASSTEKVILSSISGRVALGELLAIMGPSGSGKVNPR